jgi:hypothetical protein
MITASLLSLRAAKLSMSLSQSRKLSLDKALLDVMVNNKAHDFPTYGPVTDLLNVLPGNGSVNAVQYATIYDVVISMLSVLVTYQ